MRFRVLRILVLNGFAVQEQWAVEKWNQDDANAACAEAKQPTRKRSPTNKAEPTEKENQMTYKHIYEALAQGKTIQLDGAKWYDLSEEGVLRNILNGTRVGNLRVKPSMILVNGHEVPRPMERFKGSEAYFYVDFCSSDGVSESLNTGHALDHYRMKFCVCHKTREACVIHVAALTGKEI